MKKNIAIILCGFMVVFCFYGLWVKNSFKEKENKMLSEKIESYQYLGHINKGERIKTLPQNLAELSPRASYLNTKQKFLSPFNHVLEKMIADAEKDGVCLIVISGYRSPERQQELIRKAINDEERSLIAMPYESEHQTGLAVDLGGCPMKDGIRNDNIRRDELREPFETLPEYQWLKKNASRYGFEESFKEDNKDITGFPAEPWHWKLVIN
jgi:LAS superfamily LD-carboxypeptidase LdcB